MHGPEPAPASRPRTLLNYFKPSQATASSSTSGGGQAIALHRPATIDTDLADLLARSAANYA